MTRSTRVERDAEDGRLRLLSVYAFVALSASACGAAQQTSATEEAAEAYRAPSSPVAPLTMGCDARSQRQGCEPSGDARRAKVAADSVEVGSAPPGAVRTCDAEGTNTCWLPIPAGTFAMGSDHGLGDEKPVHQVRMKSFWILETEVTMAAYRTCVERGVCTEPGRGEACNWSLSYAKPQDPINCVDWQQARTFCSWVSGRLPSEEEWEYAARGTDGREYPWGNDKPVKTRLAWKRWFGSAHVGSTPDGNSPFGVFDMAGNVAEWTSSSLSKDYQSPRDSKELVVRGGSWDLEDPSEVRATARDGREPSYRDSDVGLRCVR